MRMPKRFEQRCLALGLMVLAVILVYLAGVHFWFTAPLLETTHAMPPLREAGQQLQTQLAQRDTLQARMAQAEDTSTLNDTLLAGPDSGAAVAQVLQLLASDLQAVANQGGTTQRTDCSITNRMPSAPDDTGAYVQVKVGVSLECPIEPLAKLIYTLENGHPYLFIDTLSIHHNLGTENDTRLSVQMLVTGYLHTLPAAGAAP